MDALINEAVANTEAQAVNESTEEQNQEDAVAEEQPADQEEEHDQTPFPKKAVNAISRRDKMINKLRAELNQIRNQQGNQQSNQAQKQNYSADENSKPSEDDFDTYADYISAMVDYKAEQKYRELTQTQQQQQTQLVQQQYIQQKHADIAEKMQQHIKTIPDFKEVLETNADILASLPLDIQNVFYNADDTAMAFYNLVKSGEVDKLFDVQNPTQAAFLISKHDRPTATRYSAQSKAPPPPKNRVTGASQGSGSLADKNPADILKWLES